MDVNTGDFSEKVGLYICNVIFVGVGRELAILLHQLIRVHESNTVISEIDWSNLLGMVILPNKQDWTCQCHDFCNTSSTYTATSIELSNYTMMMYVEQVIIQSIDQTTNPSNNPSIHQSIKPIKSIKSIKSINCFTESPFLYLTKQEENPSNHGPRSASIQTKVSPTKASLRAQEQSSKLPQNLAEIGDQ